MALKEGDSHGFIAPQIPWRRSDRRRIGIDRQWRRDPLPPQPLLICSCSESEHLLVTISRETGCVTKLESKDQVWNLEGAGMRLHVPAPEHRFHYLTERHAGRPQIESDDKQAIITWTGFESQRMGKLDIEVKETVRLRRRGRSFQL